MLCWPQRLQAESEAAALTTGGSLLWAWGGAQAVFQGFTFTIRLLCVLWAIEKCLAWHLSARCCNVCTYPSFLPSFPFCQMHNKTLSLPRSQTAKAGILRSTNLWNDSADTSTSLSPLLTCILRERKRVLLRQETGQKHSWRAGQIASA